MRHSLHDFLFVHHSCRLHVVAGEFVAIVGQVLELDALGMSQEEQIDGLVYGLKVYLLVAYDETPVGRDA